MKDQPVFENLRDKYADEDRAKLVMLQLRTLMGQKQKKKWYQKLNKSTKTQPSSWSD
ncbi:hypothetical protein [Paenibacillus roseipurpureus]|uniref:Uncharacterized protein n=1 Tax=Paenibacillus roseopurpureus TaxID=2918901 RepID=A0AA96LY00_9BACL|nr:hypothetical protein [Paenibacillus sp. MBLB1832]WNR46600.1 hypothetical protein MJB10_11075 [Paenibacillus sp. MBLB1832]